LLQKRAALTALAALARPPSSAAGLRASARNLAGTLYSSAQWAKLAAYERRVLRAVDAAVAVSEQDARALRRLAPEVRLAIAPNGVDTAHFSRPGLAALTSGGPTLVFSGTLDYRPNLDALAWFVAEVLPRIRAARPDVRLVAVGKRPAPELRQMAARGELVLTGEVADARPFIAGADVYVVPMRIGGGIRLKLLEALSLEAPTVSTSLGAEGVEGLRHAEHCLLADTPAAFAEAVLRLLDDREYARRLGAAGRSLVRARYDWSAIVPRLEALYSDLAGA
ncbi:MAG: glycosyltransferase family 4 protein, partial [Chloroflexota bacterium]